MLLIIGHGSERRRNHGDSAHDETTSSQPYLVYQGDLGGKEWFAGAMTGLIAIRREEKRRS